MRLTWLGVATAVAAASSCGSSGRARFESDVAPLLERRCLGLPCHGVAQDAEARGEILDWTHFLVRVGADGRIADMDRAYATVKARIDTVERAELSSLLRKPLAREAGGVPHMGGALWQTRDDASYRALLAWAKSETGGGEGARVEDLTPLQQRFAKDVQPLLGSRQCMNAACHGLASPFTAFEPPMELDGALVFSAAATLKNYAAARAHLQLGGVPNLSRLVRKTLPLDGGGILHRGGNDIFFRWGTPASAAIEAWAGAERDAALGGAQPGLRGIVYVRGPVPKERPFEPGAFTPGSDLWVADAPAFSPRNLTAAAHTGPADVRDPAVNHDATRVVFSMRASGDGAFNVWEVGLDGAGLRQLTHDTAGTNVQPTYGPDGRVYFVSDRAGLLADGLETLDTDVWSVDTVTGALDRVTHDPSPESTPTFFGTGKSHGTIAFTVLRGIGGAYKGVVFRAPLDHNAALHADPELHIHHGLTEPGEVAYAARETMDGRMAFVSLGRDADWRAGALAILDRQLGPRAPAAAASVPGYRDALTPLDGAMLYRHPVALPDGRLLVSVAAPASPPVFSLVALTLEEDRATGAPRIAKTETIAGDATASVHDAEPIAARPLEDDPAHPLAWTPGGARGVLAYRHVETLEAIQRSVGPAGPKPPRADLVYARLVESVPTTQADLAAGPVSKTAYGRARVLAEVPLLGGSLSLDVPAATPFRVQLLDVDRMAVGAQHNRWIDVAPGQTFPGGVSPALYPSLCAGCHGSFSGAPEGVGGAPPDLVTSASLTEATHTGMDPRRARAPDRVGDAPIAIDFERDVLPLLARSCVSCHSGGAPSGALDLDPKPTNGFDSAYEALLGELVPSHARESVVVERLYGRELDAPKPLSGACPGVPPLSLDERLLFVRWIDLGAAYRGAP